MSNLVPKSHIVVNSGWESLTDSVLNRNAADKATVYAFQLNTCKGETKNNRLHYLNSKTC